MLVVQHVGLLQFELALLSTFISVREHCVLSPGKISLKERYHLYLVSILNIIINIKHNWTYTAVCCRHQGNNTVQLAGELN